jgi:hypothetical protein
VIVPALEALMTVTATLTTPMMISALPCGERVLVDVKGGVFEGPNLKGTLDASGGDWVTIAPNGSTRLDVRLVLRTHDGVPILMRYRGVMVERVGGQRVAHVAPLFQAPAGPYDWLNHVQAIGVGEQDGDRVVYRLFRLS